jgi:phage terminase large subunit-like protein
VRGTDGEIYDGVGDLPPGVNVAPGGVLPEEDITVLWPDRRDASKVLYDIVDSGESLAIWRRENQLDPQALSGEVFKSDWLNYVDSLPHPATSYDWHAAMDVAVVEDLQAAAEGDTDYSSVAVAAVDTSGASLEMFVFPPVHERGLSVKGNRDFGVRAVSDITEGYDVEVVDMVVEANKAPGVAQRLRDETDLPARPVDSTDGKESRIHDFGGAVESAEVQFVGASDDDVWRDWEVNEWLQFPNAGHIDRTDAMAILYRELDSGDDAWSGSDVGLGGL